ncbi:MAG: hypothetical protein KDA63_17325 [Planctomycetales bacterium]|nr:hypothetical protein [Planctomycetales bacterium]
MSRVFRGLALAVGTIAVVLAVAAPSQAQESRQTISRRITSARGEAAKATHASARSYPVRPAQYVHAGSHVIASPEMISPGVVVEGSSSGQWSEAQVDDCSCSGGQCSDCNGGCDDGGCGSNGGRRRRNQQIEGTGDPWFNCNCNGSYKYPVPPLYTYHWPGLFSQELMTNYHSPWRFPPLRPYRDEPKSDVGEEPQASFAPDYLPTVHGQPASDVETAPRRRGYEPLSAKFERFYGQSR